MTFERIEQAIKADARINSGELTPSRLKAD